jgi:hypothetical protein
MIVYVVDVDVDESVFAEYLAWLDAHLQEMLALPGFISAETFERKEPAPAPGRRSVSAHYRLKSAADLERYLREDAARMRADGTARFPGKFTATRQVLVSR